MVNKFFQPGCTSNTFIQPHRPEHGRVPCVGVAITSQKTPLHHIVKNHFEIMSHIHQNTLSKMKNAIRNQCLTLLSFKCQALPPRGKNKQLYQKKAIAINTSPTVLVIWDFLNHLCAGRFFPLATVAVFWLALSVCSCFLIGSCFCRFFFIGSHFFPHIRTTNNLPEMCLLKIEPCYYYLA